MGAQTPVQIAESLAVAETVVGWASGAQGAFDERRIAGWGAAQWAAARHAALVHGVAPLLADRLGGGPAWQRLDPGLRGYLAEQLELNTRRTALMLADLGEIRRAAAAAGASVLPLKGAVLAASYYPAPGLRPMADLDLLVRPADEQRLAATMAELGFTLVEATPRHRTYHRGELRVASYEGEHPENPRCIEVHTGVAEHLRGMQLDLTDVLWANRSSGDRASPAFRTSLPGCDQGPTTKDQPLRSPSGPGPSAFGPGQTGKGLPAGSTRYVDTLPGPGALLQHLLLHTCHNLFNRRLRFIQLYDLALVAPRLDDGDWAALLAQARETGEARMFYAPLALAERYLGPLAPAAVREELAAATPQSLRHQVAIATPSDLSLCNPREAPVSYKLAWYRPGPERWRAIRHVALPTARELRQRYPRFAAWTPAAYLLHLGHVLHWGAGLALRRARRSVAPTPPAPIDTCQVSSS